jgi:hypothetical protein
MAIDKFNRPGRAVSISAKLPAVILAIGLTLTLSSTAAEAAPQTRERQELLSRIISDINITPDHACSLPQTAIENWLAANINAQGLMDNVARTVFRANPNVTPAVSGYEALMEKTRAETARGYAESQAIYHAREAGGQTPVGEPSLPEAPKYRTELQDIKAVRRIDNGLDCSARANVGSLRLPITYNVFLDANDKDGWSSKLETPPLNEAAALSDSPAILIHYNGRDLTLMQARQQSQIDVADRNTTDERVKQQNAARAAYERSPGGRTVAAQQRQAMVGKQKACEAHGGTSGVPFGSTIVQVDPQTANGLAAMTQACYFLGNR